MQLILRFAVIALTVYVGLCLALFVFQRSLIYSPQPRSYGDIENVLTLPVAGERLAISTRAHAGPSALIYFGGNAEDVSASLASFAEAFPDHAIYLMHYRGFGGSSGSPTEENLSADALALFDRVHSEHALVSVMGRSLGSGVAVRLASQRPVKHLVLITPYDSILSIAEQQFPYLPVRWLLKDRFESWRYAPEITAPTLVLQAEHDEIIPAQDTERLVAAFGKHVATRIVVSGVGHNDISGSAEYLISIRAALLHAD
jgi:uncharacterized protein